MKKKQMRYTVTARDPIKRPEQAMKRNPLHECMTVQQKSISNIMQVTFRLGPTGEMFFSVFTQLFITIRGTLVSYSELSTSRPPSTS